MLVAVIWADFFWAQYEAGMLFSCIVFLKHLLIPYTKLLTKYCIEDWYFFGMTLQVQQRMHRSPMQVSSRNLSLAFASDWHCSKPFIQRGYKKPLLPSFLSITTPHNKLKEYHGLLSGSTVSILATSAVDIHRIQSHHPTSPFSANTA